MRLRLTYRRQSRATRNSGRSRAPPYGLPRPSAFMTSPLSPHLPCYLTLTVSEAMPVLPIVSVAVTLIV